MIVVALVAVFVWAMWAFTRNPDVREVEIVVPMRELVAAAAGAADVLKRLGMSVEQAARAVREVLAADTVRFR